MLHPYTLPSRTKPTRKPKLGKEYCCPTARQKTMNITATNRPTNHGRQGSTGGNTGLAKVAVQCYADTFVVNQSLVLRINICGENRHLRQARKRYLQPDLTNIT